MSSNDTQVILEHFDDKFAQLIESLDIMIENKVRPIVQEELEPIKQDMKIIKKAVTETTKDVQRLDTRVTTLEAAA